MFRSQAVILSLQKIRDNQIRIILFTQEYGKVSCWSKKPIWSDVGNIVLVVIERKGTENHLKNIETIISLGDSLGDFDSVIEMLHFLEMLYRIIPESLELKWIYKDISETWQIIKERWHSLWKDGIIQLLILVQLRVLKKLGFLRQEYFEDTQVLLYIYRHIHSKNLTEIAEGKVLESKILNNLRENILKTRHYLIHWI